jgi:hypothetical protein
MPAHQGKFVAYFRVSTDKQGSRGLASAQREAVLTYLDGGRWSLVQELVEVESGKRNDTGAGGRLGGLQEAQSQAHHRQA